VLTRAPESLAKGRRSDAALIDAARRHVDERFGPARQGDNLVALYLVGLDRDQIARILGYRPEAVAVALGRALSRLSDEKELTWARPEPDFVEELVADVRAARPSTRRRPRLFAIAVGVLAFVVAVPAGARLAADDDEPKSGVLGVRQPSSRQPASDCLAERLDAAYARHMQEQGKLITRHARERKAVFRRLSARKRAVFEARQYREQEALLARQNRELRKLEAQPESC
jgi:hypothetical protein